MHTGRDSAGRGFEVLTEGSKKVMPQESEAAACLSCREEQIFIIPSRGSLGLLGVVGLARGLAMQRDGRPLRPQPHASQTLHASHSA